MAIFAIISQPNPHSVNLSSVISQKFTGATFALDGNQAWLVASDKTAKDVSDELGITDGSNGAAVVVEVGGYFGRANPNTWTWIQSHWDAKRNG